MRARASLVGRLAHSRLLGHDRNRRLGLGIALAACAVFTFYPANYRAAVSLTPSDPSTLGLSGTLSQLGAGANIFGNQAAIEVSIKVAKSVYVRQIVLQRLKLAQKLGKDDVATMRWLEHNVDVRIMRGGILEIELYRHDPEFAKLVVGTYADAVREQLGVIARNQTAYKRKILEDLVDQSADRLNKAQTAFDQFRATTRYGDPLTAVGQVAKKVPALDEEIESKQSQLNALRQFATDQNILVQRVKVELAELQRRRAMAVETSPNQRGSVGQVIAEGTRGAILRRELDVAQGLYDNYRRFLQGTSVEDLTSTANVRILEPAYVDPDRQMNFPAMAIGLVLLLMGLAVEFYKLRPPVGDDRIK